MAKRTGMASTEGAAEVIKLRLRDDLKSAMRAKDALETSVLRAIITALDNAQAVPAHDKHVHAPVSTMPDRRVSKLGAL